MLLMPSVKGNIKRDVAEDFRYNSVDFQATFFTSLIQQRMELVLLSYGFCLIIWLTDISDSWSYPGSL